MFNSFNVNIESFQTIYRTDILKNEYLIKGEFLLRGIKL